MKERNPKTAPLDELGDDKANGPRERHVITPFGNLNSRVQIGKELNRCWQDKKDLCN